MAFTPLDPTLFGIRPPREDCLSIPGTVLALGGMKKLDLFGVIGDDQIKPCLSILEPRGNFIPPFAPACTLPSLPVISKHFGSLNNLYRKLAFDRLEQSHSELELKVDLVFLDEMKSFKIVV
jgi:hypothetical protein